MEQTQETFPHRIRKIATDLILVRHIMENELQAKRLQELADELEEQLQQKPLETA